MHVKKRKWESSLKEEYQQAKQIEKTFTLNLSHGRWKEKERNFKVYFDI